MLKLNYTHKNSKFGIIEAIMESTSNVNFIAIVLIIFFIFSFTSSAISDDDKVTYNTDAANKGKELFQNKGCIACHTIGKGKITGPDLLGVTERREEQWLKQWLKNPDEMILTDPIAKDMLKEYFVPMPNQGLSDEDIEVFVNYFKYEDSINNKADNK